MGLASRSAGILCRPLVWRVRSLLAGVLASILAPAAAQTLLTIAAFPSVDKIVEAALPIWKQAHPTVEVKVVSRQFADHHTAMTTALSTSFYLPDVMALEVGYVGRFAQGGGLEDLARAPYLIRQLEAQFVPYAFKQAVISIRRCVSKSIEWSEKACRIGRDSLSDKHFVRYFESKTSS